RAGERARPRRRGHRVRRREFLTLFGGATTWPLAAHAQQPDKPVVGILGSVSPAPYAGFVEAIKQGLREAGYVEVATSHSNIAGRRDNTIDFRSKRLSWWIAA